MTNYRIIALLASSSLVFSFGTAEAQTKVSAKAAAAAAASQSQNTNVTVNVGTSAKSAARPKAKAKAKPRTSHRRAATVSSGVTWKNWGGAPYAANAAEAVSDAKLGVALDTMVASCGLPKEVADAIRAGDYKIIRDNPDGISVPTGQHAYLTPETKLDCMMSGGTPNIMLDVTVGKTVIGKGKVAAAEAIVYGFTMGDTTYVLIRPIICNNWSLMKLRAAPAPTLASPSPCYTIRTTVRSGNRDKSEQFGALGPEVPSECWAYRIVGKTGWNPLSGCQEAGDCFKEIADEHHMRLGRTAQVDVPADCKDCVIEWRLPSQFALSANNMAELCLVRNNGQGSCAIQVRYDDYKATVATVYYDYETATAAWHGGHKLYWRFEANSLNCKKFYRK